jgi:hypothetical protein
LNFVVFPWDVLSRIREISGAIQQSDISDYKLALIAWASYEEALREVYELHTNERPLCSPTDGAYVDGTNVLFQTANYPIADVDGDEVVNGYQPIAGIHDWDVDFTWTDSTTGLPNVGQVSVIDAEKGWVALTDLGTGNPLPKTATNLQLTYHSESPTYNQATMREAVAYLAAYRMAIAFQALNKVTLADLQTNRGMSYDRFLIKYQDLIERVGFPNIGCGN